MWIRFIWNHIGDYTQRAAIREELNSLDDKTIKDIGLCRSDFDTIVSRNFLIDPTRKQRGVTLKENK